ncbi:MAG TPA: hypothetical protein VFC63_02735 [Blastocatellia bacterium]|nr:hypothetical protein [Blastocatellia bacterium]
MDRKYKQRGYMSDDRPQQSERPKPAERPDGPRTHKLPPVHQVFRCSLCGSVVPKLETITFTTQCPKCKSDLHSCKNCIHFDTSARNECRQPIQERIKKKDMANNCTFYQPRQTVERETTTSSERITDARSAFDKLFKK